MTDRHAAYIVTLEQDVRTDDAEEGVLNAIRQIRGVLSVEPVIGNHTTHIAEERARARLREELRDVLWGERA